MRRIIGDIEEYYIKYPRKTYVVYICKNRLAEAEAILTNIHNICLLEYLRKKKSLLH